MPERVRVIVLGGGMAGVAAAMRLADTPAKRARFDVTLVEASWRLGGKGATGRDLEHHARIEEHGLHVWMGFYEHAFALVRDALIHAPELGPIDALFLPDHTVELVDRDGRAVPFRLPERPGKPWLPPGRDLSGALTSLAALVPTLVRSHVPWARLSAALARGLAVDILPHGPRGLARLDRWDLRAWLRRHGADDEVLDAPPILAFYALSFAHPDGRSGPGRGQVAAGAALRSLARILVGYRGAPFWRLRHGMGDGVFAPLYRALVAQGVRIDWMTRVVALEPARDAARLDAILLERRGVLAGAPLLEVRGRPAWPKRPALVDVAPAPRTLRIGADFDLAVLAVPIDLHPAIAPELLRRFAPLRRMVDAHRSVATRALQVWLRDPPAARARIASGMAPPYSAHGDLTEVLDAEDWPPEQRPRALWYFVDACPDPHDPAAEPALARRFLAEELARRLGSAALAAPPYVRINDAPGERYILTPPGSTESRLAPGESGLANLFLAGDWTRTSINGGSIEAAAESGVEAARVITRRFGAGLPRTRERA